VRRHRRLADRHSTAADRRAVATWDDELVERLTGQFVIRYDLRDTGRSTTADPDSPGYTLHDLVTDAVGVLDGLGIARAHVVGIATGGFIAQLLALDHPSRVASLVLAGTRPVAPGPVDDDLPGHSPAVMAYFGSAAPVDWTDRTSILDGAVGRGPRVLRLGTIRRRRGPRPRGRCSRSLLRPAPGVGAHRPAERGVLEAGLHATLARTAPGDHRTDTGGCTARPTRSSRWVMRTRWLRRSPAQPCWSSTGSARNSPAGHTRRWPRRCSGTRRSSPLAARHRSPSRGSDCPTELLRRKTTLDTHRHACRQRRAPRPMGLSRLTLDLHRLIEITHRAKAFIVLVRADQHRGVQAHSGEPDHVSHGTDSRPRGQPGGHHGYRVG